MDISLEQVTTLPVCLNFGPYCKPISDKRVTTVTKFPCHIYLEAKEPNKETISTPHKT